MTTKRDTLAAGLAAQEPRLTDEEMQQIATADHNKRLASAVFTPKRD